MKIKCFHLSYRKNRESILESGLLPKAKKGTYLNYPERIYFATTRKDLAFDYVGIESVDVWEFYVDSIEMKIDTISTCNNHFYITQPVPAHELKLVQCY